MVWKKSYGFGVETIHRGGTQSIIYNLDGREQRQPYDRKQVLPPSQNNKCYKLEMLQVILPAGPVLSRVVESEKCWWLPPIAEIFAFGTKKGSI